MYAFLYSAYSHFSLVIHSIMSFSVSFMPQYLVYVLILMLNLIFTSEIHGSPVHALNPQRCHHSWRRAEKI